MRKLVILMVGLVLSAAGPVAAAYSRADAGWYIGFGLGWGTGFPYDNSGSIEERGGLGMFKVGGVLGPHLLLGYEGGAWGGGEENARVFFEHNVCMLTFFPWRSAGFFLKGGAGLGWVRAESDAYWGSSRAGLDIRLGTGYEFQLGSSFNLGVEAVWSSTFYEKEHLGDAGLMLTFTWY